MSLLQIAKQQALARDLQERLSLRLPSYTFSQSTDASGAILSVSQSATPTAGQNNMLIRIVPFDTPFLDSIGSPQQVYSPSKLQIVEESDTDSGHSIVASSVKSLIDWDLAQLGVYQERYLGANGSVPSTAEILPANLVAKVGDYKWPGSGQ
jgi:hypothetical protein